MAAAAAAAAPAVVVREVPGKGRCLFAGAAVAKGATVLSETCAVFISRGACCPPDLDVRPLFASRPSDDPELFAAILAAHARDPFGFGHVRSHYAGACTLLRAPAATVEAICVKSAPTAPTAAAKIDAEVATVQAACSGDGVDAAVLRRLILNWEYNGFRAEETSAVVDDDALVIYDYVSTASHSCDPNVELVVVAGLARAGTGEALSSSTVLRKGETFETKYRGLALKALRPIRTGDEVTFCYVPTLDLAADFRARRCHLTEKGWTFLCHCDRCLRDSTAFLEATRRRPPEQVENANDDDDDDDDGVPGDLTPLF